MKSRILLKDIPSGKFHSAIFTTFSINLYYFEQQVLPLLGSKGIHYISVLADSNMLNAQLDTFSLLSEQRKRSYAIHGIQCNGAFHPKIIFLAGETSLLLLIGSGNLTSSGHGKNLEVWNAIYIDNVNDKKLGFVIQAWDYLKDIHSDLGLSAQHKLKSIEENCSLLDNSNNIGLVNSYNLNSTDQISFMVPNDSKSLFSQLSDLIGNEKVNKITIMSPYYDSEGKFIHLLNNQYNPTEINIILQKNFGIIPGKMNPGVNMHFYNWTEICNEEIKQKYFHAKNIVLEGDSLNFLVSGSANASIAAFGSEKSLSTNHEACVLYQSYEKNYLDLLGINLNEKRGRLADFESSTTESDILNQDTQKLVFIKAIEQNYETVTVYLSSKTECKNVTLCLYNAKGNIEYQKVLDFETGFINLQITLPKDLSLLYGNILSNTTLISNKQFAIDLKAFESTNPSPKNRSLNQIRKLIESGNFSTLKMIDYLNTIYKQKDSKRIATKAISISEEAKDDVRINEEENDLLYLSYEEIQEKIKNLEITHTSKTYVEYKSIRLLDSIFAYLKESKQKEEQAKIDEEETEDISKSTGRIEEKKSKDKTPVSISNYDRMREKVGKFLTSYCTLIESKIDNKKADKPNLIDLSMFLIILEILAHLSSHKEKIEGKNEKKYLLDFLFSESDYSWSKFAIHIIGLFTLWCSQKGGFKEIESEEYKSKMVLYKKMAFKTSLGILALFFVINEKKDTSKIEDWCNLYLLNANQSFNSIGLRYMDVSEFDEIIPIDARKEIGESNYTDRLALMLGYLNSFASYSSIYNVGDFYLHPEDGYLQIGRIINGPNDTFYKLFGPGYKWMPLIGNYWNGKVYSEAKSKWLGTK